MRSINLYLIQNSLMAILPEYTQYGELKSKMLEERDSFLLDSRPYTTIDEHYRHFGSAIIGAIEGARSILKSRVNPIALNGPELIILIPTKSPFRDDCIWLNLYHIKDFKPHSTTETLVFFSNGDTIVIDISANQFAARLKKGYILRSIMKERQNKKFLYVLDPGNRYHYQRNKGKLNFDMIIKRRKDKEEK